MTVLEARQKMERRKGERRRVELNLEAHKQDFVALSVRAGKIEHARIVIQAVAQQTQQALEYQIGELVTLALSAVFNDNWKFCVHFEPRRGRTEADLVFEDAKGHAIDPMTADGGGAVDVASKMLEIACWSLLKPRSRPVLIWDEPFKHLSTDMQPRMGEVLREMRDRLGLQFIIVTHEAGLLDCADKIFRISRYHGSSRLI